MTYVSAVKLVPDGGPRPAPLIALTRWQFKRILATMLWLIVLVGVLLPLMIWWAVGYFGPFISIWEQFATNGPAWFLFAMGVVAVANHLALHVAMGSTRGSYVTATALALFAAAICLSAFAAAGLLLEAAIFRGYGLEQTFSATHLFSNASEVGLVMVTYSLRYVIFGLAGLLTGLAYYRFGGLIGTGLLVITLLPIMAVGTVLTPTAQGVAGALDSIANATGGVMGFLAGLEAPARLGLALVVAVVAFGAVRVVAPLVPVRTKAS